MISILFSRLVILTCGMLYPAYKSFKAVRTKDAKEYMRWMMYWVALALFTSIETFADVFISFWWPFYYESKIVIILWLVSPYTKGSAILYRKWIHPTLLKHEEEIDRLLQNAKLAIYTQAGSFGRRALGHAREIVASAAMRSQAYLLEEKAEPVATANE